MKPKLALASMLTALSCSGCHASPNVEIVGSYFPAWMLSLVIAITLTVALHLSVRQTRFVSRVEPPVLVYTCIALILTCLIWLVVFA